MSVCVYMYRDQVGDERQKAKNKVRPNRKRTYEPQKRRDGRKCATGQQQQANRRNRDDEKAESDACKVGRETW
jgi:hypothetical protein